MAATGNYITETDVDQRITARTKLDIFDDDGSGDLSAAEETTLSDFILDAESEVEDVIKKTYGNAGLIWLRAEGTDAPRSIKRLCLDAFEVRAFRRHPSYIRAQWVEREKALADDLKALRVREIELATTDPTDDLEPAVRDGGEVRSGDPDATTPLDKVFLDGTGIF